MHIDYEITKTIIYHVEKFVPSKEFLNKTKGKETPWMKS